MDRRRDRRSSVVCRLCIWRRQENRSLRYSVEVRPSEKALAVLERRISAYVALRVAMLILDSWWIASKTEEDAWEDALRNSCSVSSRSNPNQVLDDRADRMVDGYGLHDLR